MKKLLALLFVCAGLTAMAAPHVNKAEMVAAKKGQMVLKTNTLTNHLTAGVSQDFMAAAKKNVQANHAANLVNKRAPRRLSDDEIIANPYVCFLYAFDVTGETPVPADPFYAGSGAYWYPDTEDGLYFAGFYWDSEGSTYYLPVDIDYSTGDVALSWGILLKDDSVIGTARNRVDTVWYEMLVSEAYWKNQEQTDCKGTLYEDGSIIFDDNYVYYSYKEERVYRNRVLQSTNVFETATMFVGTEILAANGQLDYIKEQTGAAETGYVYMFQDEDSVFVGNLWDYGVPNAKMVLTAEGKMYYPCAEFNEVDSTTYLSNPIWDVNDSWIAGGLGMFYPVQSYEVNAEGYITDYTWGMDGTATEDEISWPYTMPCNGYHFLYGYENNRLTWLNGGKFDIPGEKPIMRGDVDNDGEVAIADVTILIDHLLKGDFDDTETFSADAADCDLDGEIAIADVTILIDYLLKGNWPVEQ